MVDIALYSLAEALSDLQLRHQNHLFSANVVLFRGPQQASSSETEAGYDPVRERVKKARPFSSLVILMRVNGVVVINL